MKEEDYTKKDIVKIEPKEDQMAGTQISFYGKLFKDLNSKQKKIIIIATAFSLVAGVGVYGFYKLKNKGFKIRIGK